MTNEEFAARVEALRGRLYKTAMLYLGSHSQAMDALDEAIYRALCSLKKLRSPEYFDTWMTRILINECCNELRRQKRICPIEALPEGIAFDTAKRQGTTWTVTFRADYTEGEPIYQLFGSTCYDARGNAHEIDAWSNSFDTPDEDGNITCFLEQFPLRDYPDDEVWLSPLFSNTWTADSELIVPIS